MSVEEKLNKLISQFGNPYEETKFPKISYINQIIKDFEENRDVSAAGRLIAKREHGKSSFAHISDITGKIQVYARKDILKQDYSLFKE